MPDAQMRSSRFGRGSSAMSTAASPTLTARLEKRKLEMREQNRLTHDTTGTGTGTISQAQGRQGAESGANAAPNEPASKKALMAKGASFMSTRPPPQVLPRMGTPCWSKGFAGYMYLAG